MRVQRMIGGEGPLARWAFQAWCASGDGVVARWQVGQDLLDALQATAVPLDPDDDTPVVTTGAELFGMPLALDEDLPPRGWRTLDGEGRTLASGEWAPLLDAVTPLPCPRCGGDFPSPARLGRITCSRGHVWTYGLGQGLVEVEPTGPERIRAAIALDRGGHLAPDRPVTLCGEVPTGDAFLQTFHTPELIDGPGRIIYTPPERHACSPPERAPFGAVWRCGCGRRWTCRERPMPVRGVVSANPCMWVRRYWPWPRGGQA